MKRRRRVLVPALLALVVVGLGAGGVSGTGAQEPDPTKPAASIEVAVKTGRIRQETVDAARTRGAAPVIVRLRLPSAFTPESTLDAPAASAQRKAIAAAQDPVLMQFAPYKPQGVKRYSTIPYLALTGGTAALKALVAMPEITLVVPDALNDRDLKHSVPFIGALRVRAGNGVAGWGRGHDRGDPRHRRRYRPSLAGQSGRGGGVFLVGRLALSGWG
jgi:hypothetical protein